MIHDYILGLALRKNGGVDVEAFEGGLAGCTVQGGQEENSPGGQSVQVDTGPRDKVGDEREVALSVSLQRRFAHERQLVAVHFMREEIERLKALIKARQSTLQSASLTSFGG